ncbi:MAG: AbrB/MazE/SpoVT family DNA-binding domain-containing protein [Lentisphaeria bacterium]|nr:AbrB/MazE/SpoVT family DNA-binding domain-containing protein [Lentisphaeria bacterium]
MITKVTGKNQVTIPAVLAREFDIHPGSELEWRRGPGADTLQIRVLPSPEAALREVQELVGAYRIDPSKALADLERMREEEDPESDPPGGEPR